MWAYKLAIMRAPSMRGFAIARVRKARRQRGGSGGDEEGNWCVIGEEEDEDEGWREGYMRCWKAPELETVEEE